MRAENLEIVGGPNDGERIDAELFQPTCGGPLRALAPDWCHYDLIGGRLWWRDFDPVALLMAIFSDDLDD